MWTALALFFALAALLLLHRLLVLRAHLRDLAAALTEKRSWLLRRHPLVARQFHLDDIQRGVHALQEERERVSSAERDQLRQIEITLGNIQEGVLLVDGQNRIVAANEAFRHRFGHRPAEPGRRLETVLSDADFLDYVQKTKRGGQPARREIEVALGRETAWFEVTGARVPGGRGGEDLSLFVLHDITRLKRLERIRSEFVANVSHELRTPVTILKGFAETLAEDEGILTAEERASFMEKIRRNADRLHYLVEDLLTLSRLEAGPEVLQREPASLPDLIAEVVDDFRSRPNPHGHRLRVEIAPGVEEVPMDTVKIVQVFENLLDNAWKYCKEPAVLTLGARPGEGAVVCTVEDDGPGIPEGDLPHLFERFYRVDKGRAREQGGTGLGLAIVKHIVQQHGGTVSVESAVGEGTCFTFSLPLQRVTPPRPVPPPATSAPAP